MNINVFSLIDSNTSHSAQTSTKTIILQNGQGRILTVTLRKYRTGDEEGMIACIRDEYGDTYFKRGLYLPEYIKKEAESRRITFLVAEIEAGEIAGMLILKQFYPSESMCEIASQIFRKKYRGYGLAMPFFQYGMEIIQSRCYSAAFCLPVVFHDVTQRLLYRLGLRATGFVLNVFDLDVITHSYQNGKNTKHSQGIQIMAQGKREVGTLFLPEEHRAFCRKIYDSLSVAYCLADKRWGEDGNTGRYEVSDVFREKMPAKSNISYQNDAIQSSLEIRIRQTGKNLREHLLQIQEQFPLKRKQTANIFLNCNDPNAIRAYTQLKELGYFFTGLKPLCSEKEYLVMHHPGEVGIYFEDYVMSEEFAPLLGYVKSCYEQRNRTVTVRP